jgi:hypothetical protein
LTEEGVLAFLGLSFQVRWSPIKLAFGCPLFYAVSHTARYAIELSSLPWNSRPVSAGITVQVSWNTHRGRVQNIFSYHKWEPYYEKIRILKENMGDDLAALTEDTDRLSWSAIFKAYLEGTSKTRTTNSDIPGFLA